MSFNPRPPLLAGETSTSTVPWGSSTVSIHARHCWRARRQIGDSIMFTLEFQSTPAIAGGRDAGCVDIGEVAGNVSIHARHCWRARPFLGVIAQLDVGFQSTPAIAGGRDRVIAIFTGDHVGFNPRPPLLAGETCVVISLEGPGIVSIHARHCWRARLLYCGFLRLVYSVSIHARHCWRARPHRNGDEAGDNHVSIHARHCWRARRRHRRATKTDTCFNPRPPLLAGETRTIQGHAVATVFQSTPAIAGGRDQRPATGRDVVSQFQSTPAIAGGRDGE